MSEVGLMVRVSWQTFYLQDNCPKTSTSHNKLSSSGVVATNISTRSRRYFWSVFQHRTKVYVDSFTGAQTLYFFATPIRYIIFLDCILTNAEKDPAKKPALMKWRKELWDWSIQQCQPYL